MRAVIADDALLVREGIARILEEAGIEVVASVDNASSLRRAARIHSPDVAIIDIRMPPGDADDGLEAARQIRDERPGTSVLVLSAHLVTDYAIRLLEDQPGHVGYLLKERVGDPAILTDAIGRVTRGETVVDPGIVAALFARRRRDSPLERLTPRERTVLALVGEGRSNRAIAQELVVAERTVEAHVKQIFDKLQLIDDPGTNRRVLAALIALRG